MDCPGAGWRYFCVFAPGTSLKKIWATASIPLIASVIISIGLMVVLVWVSLSIAHQINSNSLYTRLYGWRAKLYQVSNHPWLGDGLNVRHTVAQYGNRVQWETYITQFEALLPYYDLTPLAQKHQLTFHAHNLFSRTGCRGRHTSFVGVSVVSMGTGKIWFKWVPTCQWASSRVYSRLYRGHYCRIGLGSD